jgi:hypothetical protein
MKYKIDFILFIILSLCLSCSINGSFQGLYSYYNKTKSKNPGLLEKLPNSFSPCEIKKNDTPKIYVTNGIQLQECMKSFDNAIVYVWAPKCKSKNCYPLNLLQQRCNTKNIELFIVAEYYDEELMNVNYNLQRPIFGIDIAYYSSDLTSRYLPGFIRDLTNENTEKSRFYRFKNGRLITSFDFIEEMGSRD